MFGQGCPDFECGGVVCVLGVVFEGELGEGAVVAAPVAPAAVPVVPLEELPELPAAVAMPVTAPAPSAPATIVAPRSFETLISVGPPNRE
jgi:hypothetical protein